MYIYIYIYYIWILMLYAYYIYTLLKVGEDSENSKRVLLYNLQTPHLKAFVVTYRV